MTSATTAFTVRRYVEADLGAIREIDWHSFRPDDQYNDEQYERFGAGSHQALVAVSASGDIVGYALLDVAAEPTRLRSLAVHPSHRNAGCGAALLRAVLPEASGGVDLFVEPENAAAIRVYERFGFRPADNTGELPSRMRMLRCVAPTDDTNMTIRHASPNDVEDNEEREPDALYYWRRA